MADRVLIIGGGIIGSCVAYYARKAGHEVTIAERGGFDHDMCSLGNAGMIVPSDFEPLAAPGMVSYGLRTMWNPESPFYISCPASAQSWPSGARGLCRPPPPSG